MSLAARPQDATSESTLRVLVDALGITLEDSDAVRTALSGTAATQDVQVLREAGESLGLALEVATLGVAEALSLVRRDLPVVACIPTETGTEYLVIDRMSWGRVRVRGGRSPLGSRWMSKAALKRLLRNTGQGDVRTWLIAEPLFPANALRAPDGKSLSSMGRIRGLVDAERSDVVVILVFAIATGVLALATPLAIQVLITWLAFGALLQPVLTLAAVLLVFLGFAAVLRALQRHAVEIVQRRLFVRLLRDVSERLTRVRVSAFDKSSGQELVNRFFDVLTVQKAAASLLVDGASAALQAIVGLSLLAFYHPVLLVFDIVVVIMLIVVLIPLGRGATKTAIKESKRKYEAAAWVEEIARHTSTIKLGGRHLAQLRSEAVARSYLADRSKHFTIFFRQYVGMLGVQVIIQVTLLLLCGWLVLEGSLTVGQLVAAEFIVTAALAGFSKVVNKLDTWYDLHAAVDKLGALADLPQDRLTGLTPVRQDTPAAVTLDDVSYGSIKGLSLQVNAGARSLVQVPSSQSTVLADLLVGLRTPTEGTMLRDGQDVARLKPMYAHEEVALVRGGEPLVATVRDNIAMARPGIRDGDVWEVLAKVGLAADVGALSDGLDTLLGPGGRPLCPDGATRLLFARALCGSPRLVVVDGVLDSVSASTRNDLLALTGPTTIVLTVTGLPTTSFDQTTNFSQSAA